MKFTFKPSPNYRNQLSTTDIMRYVTVALLCVVVYSAVSYGVQFGFQYGLRVVLMTLCAVVAALLTEAIYFKRCFSFIWLDYRYYHCFDYKD